MTEKDYIGPDPVKWLDRLIEVNAASDFTAGQKIAIASALRTLMRQFGTNVPTVR